MRRAERRVASFEQVCDILGRADTVRLGIAGDDGWPYVVPVSFGFAADVAEQRISLYFHGASEGRKHDLIRRDPRVCVEADVFRGYKGDGERSTTLYESFIGRGIARRVFGDDALLALNAVMRHCGFPEHAFESAVLGAVALYRIDIEAFDAKANLEPV